MRRLRRLRDMRYARPFHALDIGRWMLIFGKDFTTIGNSRSILVATLD